MVHENLKTVAQGSRNGARKKAGAAEGQHKSTHAFIRPCAALYGTDRRGDGADVCVTSFCRLPHPRNRGNSGKTYVRQLNPSGAL